MDPLAAELICQYLRRMIEAGFVILPAAVLLWMHLSIPRAAMACGDAPLGGWRARRRFLLAALAWVAIDDGAGVDRRARSDGTCAPRR